MTYFIVSWLIGAVVSWIGVAIYTKHRMAYTWNGLFEAAKANMKSPFVEAMKCLLFVIAWPIETAPVLILAICDSVINKKSR